MKTKNTSNRSKMDVRRQSSTSFYCSCLSTLFLISAACFFIWSTEFVVTDYKERMILSWGWIGDYTTQNTTSNNKTTCEIESRPRGSESLPKGIVTKTSDYEMHQLWGPRKKKNPKSSTNLLAMAVGIKQKESVNKIIKKFLSTNNFVVMLFHYDGIVNEWTDLDWSDHAIHVSAINQTKWWFAKRFLHPDIVCDYAYIFLWDEDLGVENFNVGRYLSIIKEEGLEISQPALDSDQSEVHYPFTARDDKLKVHRKVFKMIGGRKCDESSTEPPCAGWVEMMAPVFSFSSWRCTWHIIQNDLVHAWGLDFQLGYCAQGDRTKNIGIVDSEYVIHYGLPTLGGSVANKENDGEPDRVAESAQSHSLHVSDARSQVRKQSFIELEIFKNRWKKAVQEDHCWKDPYQKPT
ncbi:hypothetical protein FNV43_RR22038 [Rhamnella rubrinervis]|uniref:Uncharacterized protein n=1 Tax=Rhamnella rubrinervis TaxID=2594499 RepID=A0A8K0GRP8_9ROSA|nr:hypothetical protein FNV43_RR22038 [Rhamnella rubrinervis]